MAGPVSSRHPKAPSDARVMLAYLPVAVLMYLILAGMTDRPVDGPAWGAMAAAGAAWLIGVPLGEWRRALRVPASVMPRDRLLDVLRGMGYRRQTPDGDAFRSHFIWVRGKMWISEDDGDTVITARRATLWQIRNVLDMDRRARGEGAPKTVHQVDYAR